MMMFNKLIFVLLACGLLHACTTGVNQIPNSNFKIAQKEIYLGNYPEARNRLESSYKEATFKLHRGEITYWTGYTYLCEKRYSLAAKYFKNADLLYPAGILKGQILARLVCALIEDGQIDEAKLYARKAETLKVEEAAEIKEVMAKYYYNKDDLGKAKDLYTQIASTKNSANSESEEKLTEIGTGDFYLQVGLFSSKENADKVIKKINTEYYIDAYIVEEYKDRAKLYSVRIGKFKTRSDAELKYNSLTRKYSNLRLIVKP